MATVSIQRYLYCDNLSEFIRACKFLLSIIAVIGRLSFFNFNMHCGAVVITTAQLHSTKPEIRLCASSNPACGLSEIHNGEDL